MTLTIKVQLHHVDPSQIDCNTSKTKIELSTRGRRKYRLSRPYPNGIECDDESTQATLKGNTLILELPITKLGRIPSLHASLPDSALEVAGAASSSTAAAAASRKRNEIEATAGKGKGTGLDARKKAKAGDKTTKEAASAVERQSRGSEVIAEGSQGKKRIKEKSAVLEAASPKTKPKTAKSAVQDEPQLPSKANRKSATDNPPVEASARPKSPTTKEKPSKSSSKAKDKGSDETKGAKNGSSAVDTSLMAALEHATAAEDARRAKSIDKMRGFEAAEQERERRKREKELAKAKAKQTLLGVVKEQKRAAKSAKTKAKAVAKQPATPSASSKPRKRVTFSPQLDS